MTTLVDAFLDIEGAHRAWVNSLTTTLVGRGHPLALGAHLRRLRSPASGTYALISSVGGGDEWTAESTTGWARISASIYSATSKQNAAYAAAAYANVLRLIPILRPVLTAQGVQLVAVDSITGPLYSPDGDEERYLVDAEIHAVKA
jgi:hypothetical protein